MITKAAAVEKVHADLTRKGFAVALSSDLGLPSESTVIAALQETLQPDPRGLGKLHARDVLSYARTGDGDELQVTEHVTNAHIDGTDDYSRFRFIGGDRERYEAAETLLNLIPHALRRQSGLMSADYFRYSPGTGASPHQDGFGDVVIIWVLDRNGDGAESFLMALDGRDVTRGPLAPGSVLIFRDDMFLHGVTPLRSGRRDALIFITLKGGA